MGSEIDAECLSEESRGASYKTGKPSRLHRAEEFERKESKNNRELSCDILVALRTVREVQSTGNILL
ncbi:hypothetical protein J6590_003471 [Homalodisca vitripennis]|nr:hypothetical protein J6590_003471 [Homalodisca vitripennis]